MVSGVDFLSEASRVKGIWHVTLQLVWVSSTLSVCLRHKVMRDGSYGHQLGAWNTQCLILSGSILSRSDAWPKRGVPTARLESHSPVSLEMWGMGGIT